MYTLLLTIINIVLYIIALFNGKMKLFVNGRKQTYRLLEEGIAPGTKTIWMHTASLGEFEQGLPVLEQLRILYPKHKLVVTFFSPSGYEVKKNSPAADVITYLPLDTHTRVKRFLNMVNPELSIFVKYEFWPNYLSALKKRNIPTLLISGIFREKQVFFKWYGGYMRKALSTFNHFFLQDEASANLIKSIGYNHFTVCGDTRFDRVLQILKRDNRLDFIETFKNGKPCIVIGSSWPEDERILLPFINSYQGDVKFIIAPHVIKPQKIEAIKNGLTKNAVCFTEMEAKHLADYKIFIIDSIGILTKIYSYANIAYVGGGMGTTGLHNTLEPAVFGIPVIIGKNYSKFNEAKQLVEKGGIISVASEKELADTMTLLLEDWQFCKHTGDINYAFLQANANATNTIIDFIKQHYRL